MAKAKKSNKPFDKFIYQEEKGSKKKERIRQEKKKARQEKKEYFEKKKEEERSQKYEVRGTKSEVRSTKYEIRNTKYEGGGTKSEGGEKKSEIRNTKSEEGGRKPAISNEKSVISNKKSATANPKPAKSLMPLNKYIAYAGICSRRDAADLVKSGKVKVNNEVITEPGHKVSDKDEVKYNNKKISARKNLVYILLNKPKDYITTTEDPQGRKTIMDIVRKATTERIYPVGRLDRNTTGVILLTNDGELAQKLAHPSYEVKKIYEVKLDKPLLKKDFDTILKGITLEDGFISPDTLAYADSKDKSVIGIEIHSGRNRIVRRIFEHVGYDVRNLDRVLYANLTKKNVDRGKWRFLTEKEVRLLKFLNASYTRK